MESRIAVAARAGAVETGVIHGGLIELHIAILQRCINGCTFDRRGVDRVEGDVRLVQSLLGVLHGVFELLAALLDANRLIFPVCEDAVAGDPGHALVAGNGGKMTGESDHHFEGGAERILPQLAQFRVGGGDVIGDIGEVAVDAVQVRRAMHGVELLADAAVEILGLGDSLRVGHPGGDLGHDQAVIGGYILQDAESMLTDGVERQARSGACGFEEAQHFAARTIEILIGEMAFI